MVTRSTNCLFVIHMVWWIDSFLMCFKLQSLMQGWFRVHRLMYRDNNDIEFLLRYFSHKSFFFQI
jgi:hypothetical protein